MFMEEVYCLKVFYAAFNVKSNVCSSRHVLIFSHVSSTFPGRIHESKARFVLLMTKDQVNHPVIGVKTFEPTSGFRKSVHCLILDDYFNSNVK